MTTTAACPACGEAHLFCRVCNEPVILCYDDDGELDDGVCADCQHTLVACWGDPVLYPYERYRWLRLKGLIRGSVTTLS